MEDLPYKMFTPVKLNCTFPRGQLASTCNGHQEGHRTFTVSVAHLRVKYRNGAVPPELRICYMGPMEAFK